jgi:tetratricopeptide (TPR) repeat protein
MRRPHKLCLGIAAVAMATFVLPVGAAPGAAPVSARAGGACGGFPYADNGPHDYRKVRDKRLHIVEQFHFTPNVETLRSGNSSAYVGAELDFVLRAFPNHHRALVSMARLSARTKKEQPPGSGYTIDCWLERATRFAPDDPLSRMLRADWLGKRGRLPEALDQLKVADALASENPVTLHNIGLVYLEIGQYDLARERAHQAHALGLRRTNLKEALQALGHWREPTESNIQRAASQPVPAAVDARGN